MGTNGSWTSFLSISLENCLSPTDFVRNLGVLIDSEFCFTDQVNSVSKSCFANLCDIHHTRCFLSSDVSVMVANALVSSCLDYCNFLFHSLSSNSSKCVTRFVSDASRFTHIIQTLKSLHWLRVTSSSNPSAYIQVPHH